MPSPTALQRTLLFTVALIAAMLVGRLGLVNDSGASLYWPVSGVIVLWALLARRWVEFGALVVVTMAVIAIANDLTGYSTGESLFLAFGNLSTGLATRWTAYGLVKVGRPLGFVARSSTSLTSTDSAQEVIARLSMPYDVFRLIIATFVGASVGTALTMLVLSLDGPVPAFVEGAVLVIRNLAGGLLIAGTGLAMRQRGKDLRTASYPELALLILLTTGLAATAHVLSPYIPLAMATLLPLFWSGVRATTAFAAAHASYTSVVVLILTALNQGEVFGVDAEVVSLSVRLHLFVIVTVLISLVVSTAVNEFLRINAELTDIADLAQRGAAELKTVTETIPDALLIVDQDGQVTPLNASARGFVVPRSDGHLELVSTNLPDRTTGPPEDLPSARALAGETVHRFPFTFVNDAGKTQTYELNSAPLIPEGSNEQARALLLIRDVTEHHRLLAQLEHTAESDPLTGLFNRRRFDRELTSQTEQFRRYAQGGGLLVLDLDGFKEINDTFGHAEGDRVLVEIARILRDSLRSTDVTARLGGDEFAVLIPFADRPKLQTVAELLVERIRGFARTLDGAGRALTASIGGTTFADAIDEGIDLLITADIMMYEAKNSGRDCIMIFGACDGSTTRLLTQSEWKMQLERALDADDLILHLQPLLDVASGRIIGAEALVRMVGGDGEIVPPSVFVPIAERSGLAPVLDRWVIDEALEILGRLRGIDPGFSMWVNLSAQSINDEATATALIDSLESHSVPARAVVLEVTETAELEDVAAARVFATRIREMGVQLAIDDFGTGFGSFLYLKHLLFDYVKVDGEFITNLDTSDTDCTIVRSIVSLAGELGMQVVAEHVRSPEILGVVRAEGIEFAQGFGIGRPCPESEFVGRFLSPTGGSHPS